jgi:DNA-directed RNA polymerase specialized sigma24 family protein
MSKVFSVDPTGWILDSALEDYYRTVLPFGDSTRPLTELQAVMEAPPGHDVHPHAAPWNTDSEELSALVKQALRELPEIYQTVIEALWGGGLSLREAEHFTGIPKTTVARKRDEVPELLGKILKRLVPDIADRYYIED